MSVLGIAATCVLSVVASYVLVRRLITVASRIAVDVPNARSSHTRPTPRGGGLAIAVLTTLGMLGTGLATAGLDARLAAYLCASVFVAAVGFVDDVRSLAARTRLITQGLAAAAVLAVYGCFDGLSLPLLGTVSFGPLGCIVSWFWIVGLTNAYNFMDGIDGIAGGQGVVAGAAFAVAGHWLDVSSLFWLGTFTACTSLGFLGLNWSPARIFMGDVGSTFLGFSFAVAPLMLEGRARAAGFFLAVLAVWPFVLDVNVTLVRRIARGARLSEAHREHFYQRLIQSGRSHASVAMLYIAAAALGAGLGLTWLER